MHSGAATNTNFIAFGLNRSKLEPILDSVFSNVHLKIGLVYMVFNATFNNISDISWWSVLLVAETIVPCENHQPVASHRQT
jgi:hypothetical protein